MGAVIQLERFDRAAELSAPPPVFSEQELAAAFENGRAQGLREAESRERQSVIAALRDVERSLERAQTDQSIERARVLRSIQPALEALMDGIMPRLARARLEAALLDELIRLAEAASPLSPVIRCGPDLENFVTACIAQAGMQTVALDPTAPEGTAEVTVLGGTVTWDMATAARNLGDLFRELIEGL